MDPCKQFETLPSPKKNKNKNASAIHPSLLWANHNVASLCKEPLLSINEAWFVLDQLTRAKGWVKKKKGARKSPKQVFERNAATDLRQ